VPTAQKLEENGISASLHPAFSPDFALFDFFPFGALKRSFADRIFESADELIEGICEMTRAIARAKRETVFLEWEERLQRCNDITGSYID
jgi:hypothetical protein